MSAALTKAKEQLAAGQAKKAVGTLWVAEAQTRGELDQTRALLEVARAAREQVGGGLRGECDELIERAEGAIRGLSEQEQERGAVAALSQCKVLGGHGLPPRTGEQWDLAFYADELELRTRGSDPVVVAYPDIVALEIGGPGATSSGGGFAGGGFGVQGAAEGMLIATALNLLTTRSRVDTVICLQTQSAELFLHTSRTTPDALRMRLSQVFTALRAQAPEPMPTAPAVQATAPEVDPVERLHRLSELLEKGLISRDEFDRLKADLLS
jgi:Short C-terminal domain